MKKALLVFVVLVFSYSVKSQNIARNTFQFELGGAAGLYSINYERLLLDSVNFNIGLSVGITYFPHLFNYDRIYGAPFRITFLKQIGRETYFEFGAFYTYMNASNYVAHESRRGMGDTIYAPLPPTTYSWETDIYRLYGFRGGYRHHPVGKGVFWSILIQATISKENNLDSSWEIMTPWVSFSLGYSF